MLVLVALVLTVAFLLRLMLPYQWSSLQRSKFLRRIPGPTAYPVVGNIKELIIPREDLPPQLIRLAKQHGPVWKICVLGFANVFLIDPDDVELVLSSKTYNGKGLDYYLLRRWLGTGLLTSKGEKWRKHRKILTPAFHFKILESYVPVFNKHGEILVEKLKALMSEKYVHINEIVSLCTLDVICETTMGVAINAQRGGHSEYVRSVKRMGEIFNYRQMSPWLYHPWAYSLSSTCRDETKLVEFLHKFTEQVIKERKSDFVTNKLHLQDEADLDNPKRYRTFLDILLEAAEDNGLSETNIREEVDTFMFEGHDTTATAICWALFLLGNHEEVQEKAVAELEGIFGDSDRDPDYGDLQKMKYLEQVIKEALRLYPSVPGFSRLLKVDLQTKSFLVPEGSNVLVIPYLIHRNPKIFPDPEVFNPDRFLPDNALGRHPYAYLPFSAGPRNCIGQKFALLEEKAILSRILRRFKLTSLEKQEDVKILLEMVLRPSQDVKIRFDLRH